MNYKKLAKFISLILAVEAILMVPAFLIALFNKETEALRAFALTAAISGGVSAVLAVLGKNADNAFFQKDGLACVGMGWITLCLFGCLPFVVSRTIPNFLDALFETVSGFTTTGASVVTTPEALPKSILYWRSFTHWVGGMGVLVLLLAIFPLANKRDGSTIHIMRAESPGPEVDKLVPKIRSSAAVLYHVYLVITALNVALLLIGGMSFIDALCTAFGTVGTGGLGIRSDSMASFSPYIQIVTTVFMFLSGVNFSCYYFILLGKIKSVLRDEELRLYVIVILASVLLVSLNIFEKFSHSMTLGDTVLHAAFNVVSIVTTTGYTTVNFDVWPAFSKVVLLILMFTGACAGSTAGGFKQTRVLTIGKNMKHAVSRVFNPGRVKVVTLNKRPLSERLIENTNGYLVIYLIILALSLLVVSVDSALATMEESISAVMSCFNNIGPGFGAVGPTGSFAGLSPLTKVVLIFDMLLGRLEIFPILVLFNVKSWRHGNKKQQN